MVGTVLIVDDDPVDRGLLERLVVQAGYRAVLAPGGEEALARLEDNGESAIDIALVDLVMPDLDGLAVITRARAAGRTQPIIALTSPSGLDGVMAAIGAGAFDFVVKPAGPERLQVSLMNAFRQHRLRDAQASAQPLRSGPFTIADLARIDPAISRMQAKLDRIAKSNWPVLIEGQEGTGKTRLAKALHHSSGRSDRWFEIFDCDAAEGAPNLSRLEAALRRAKEGTLYLRSIEALPEFAQIDLKERLINGAGASASARIFAGTRISLIDAVREGRFREDLFYRLTTTPLRIPHLSERPADLSVIAETLALKSGIGRGKTMRGLTADALAHLKACEFPRNFRDVEAAITDAVARSRDAWLHKADFDTGGAPDDDPAPRGTDHSASPMTDGLALLSGTGTLRSLAEIEADIITFACRHYGGGIAAAARDLGIGRSTLYRKIKDARIDPSSLSIHLIGDAA